MFVEEPQDDLVPVLVAPQPGAQPFARALIESPQRQRAVEKQQAEKLERPDPIRRRDGDPFAVHLNGALPLLEIEPRANQEPDDDRHHVAPILPVIRRQFGKLHRPGAGAHGVHNDDGNGRRHEQPHRTMAELDALDVEFLAKQNRGRQNDEERERHVERPRLETQRLPAVADKSEDGQGDGQQLIKKKHQPEGPRPGGEKPAQ